MNNPLVTIVIPAYNVELYIKKCVVSCLNQTYKNVEIIVVNDGSKDDTLNQLSEFNDKITIINQENMGVSYSRNIGINNAKGKFICFVDGDDYLDEKYVEIMVYLANKYSTDMVISTKAFTHLGEKQEKKCIEKVLSKVDATALLLSSEVIVGCWNKLFRLDFLKDNNIGFEEELFYGEGLRFITTASQYSNGVAVTNKKIYYYRRSNEYSATFNFNINKYINGEKSLLKIKNTMILNDKKIDDMWQLHMCMFCLGAVTKLSYFKQKEEYKKEYKHWLSYLRKNIWSLLILRNISLYRKMLLLGGCISPRLMGKLENSRKKKIVSRSVK